MMQVSAGLRAVLSIIRYSVVFFFFQAEDGIRDLTVTGVQTCALPISRQRFLATLPGAILAVGCWIGLSYLLGVYFRHFANFNKTYGTLGAAVALMVWLYWTGFAMLVGAELNSELAKITKKGKLQEKQQASSISRIDLAA